MDRTKFIFNIIRYAFLVSTAKAVQIQFYQNENLTDLIYESGSTLMCNNFPVPNKYNVGSIQTDTCILVYMDPDCFSTWSIKILHNSRYPLFWALGSFHICNDNVGGRQLNIDITDYFEKSTKPPKILESYKDVCTCINIPDYIQKLEKWSINNHGNEFMAYYYPNCSDMSSAKFIRAGQSLDSDMHRHILKAGGNMHLIKSIGPIINSTYYEASCCPYSKIMRMELFEISRSTELLSIKSDTTNICKTDLESIQFVAGKADSILFFAEANFRDFLQETDVVDQCHNLPLPDSRRWVTDVIGSVITETCVLIYTNYNCTGRSIKLQPGRVVNLTRKWESTVTGPNTLSLIYTTLKNWTWTTKSFHACHDEEGGPHLNVDFTQYHLNISTNSTILETFKNVKLCQNIPKYIRGMEKWSINNHGNPMLVYFEPDCSTDYFETLLIPAGVSSFSIGLSSFKRVDKFTGNFHTIQSFSNSLVETYSGETCNTYDYFIPKNKFLKKLDHKCLLDNAY